MKYLAAYCLLALSGKKDITADDIKKVLKEVPADINEENIKKVIDALKGKELHEVIKAGMSKVGQLSFGSGNSNAGAQAQQAAPAKETKEKKKEEVKKEEPKEEEAEVDMGGLFD